MWDTVALLDCRVKFVLLYELAAFLRLGWLDLCRCGVSCGGVVAVRLVSLGHVRDACLAGDPGASEDKRGRRGELRRCIYIV